MLTPAAHSVLVIDDDQSIGQEICESLALRNLSGSYAENISQARQKLANEASLGIVIVDYHMPEMNGIDVIETLRREIPHKLEFIMLTGDNTQTTAIEAVRAQAFDFLRKPFTGTMIAEAVHRASERLTKSVEADNRNELLKVEAQALNERLNSLSEMLCHRENLVHQLLMSDRSSLGLPPMIGNQPLVDANGADAASADLATVECLPVNIAALLHRILPAIQQVSSRKQVLLKATIPPALPFLCGDEARLSRAITNLAVVLIEGLSKKDRLGIIAMKEAGELLLSFRITSKTLAEKCWDMFALDLTEIIDRVDNLDGTEIKLVGTRIMVHLHGGRVSIGSVSNSEWFLRLFFPLPLSEVAH